MKRFLVFMANLALVPLQGDNPPGGKKEEFDEIDKAKEFAKNEKDNWDLVFVYRRIEQGKLEDILQYQKGRKY